MPGMQQDQLSGVDAMTLARYATAARQLPLLLAGAEAGEEVTPVRLPKRPGLAAPPTPIPTAPAIEPIALNATRKGHNGCILICGKQVTAPIGIPVSPPRRIHLRSGRAILTSLAVIPERDELWLFVSKPRFLWFFPRAESQEIISKNSIAELKLPWAVVFSPNTKVDITLGLKPRSVPATNWLKEPSKHRRRF